MNFDADQNTVSGPVRSSNPIPSKATKSACRASGSFVVIGINLGVYVISDRLCHVYFAFVNTCQAASGDPKGRRNAMFETESASKGVKFALLEGQLLTRELDRATFVRRATGLGLPAPAVSEAADKYLPIAANQTVRRAGLRASYDYIVIGSGASGSVVARRLAENHDAQVLLLEAGGDDLKPGVLITETWFFNQGGELDWNFGAERSPSVNDRSIVQAMGKALGGGTSINAMVWAQGHKNDFDHWANEAGDDAWDYRHVLDIYRRIEDWHGTPDAERRGSGGGAFGQPEPQ